MSERFDFTGDELAPAYRAAVDAIEAGDLVVLPTDTVYGLAADAFKSDAVQRLLDAKGRGRDMPPPVLISVVESLDALATDVPEAGRKLCEKFWPGPLTVICHAQGSLMWDLGETQGTVALRVPDHENTRELLSRTGPLAVSSANKSGQPAALDVYDAEEQLGDAVAVYLDGGEVTGGEPSTIIDITTETPRLIRLGALTLAQLREIVPELEADDPTAEHPAEAKPADVVADEKPAEDKPAEVASADKAAETVRDDAPAPEQPAEAGTDDKPVEPAADKPAEGVSEDKAETVTDDSPTAEQPAEAGTDDKPVEPAADKPAEAVAGEKPTEVSAEASKQNEKPATPDVRPAD